MKEYMALLLVTLWSSTCLANTKNIFFKDLASHPLYQRSHIFRVLETVFFRDSIMYVQDSDYLLVNTNNSILNLDASTLEEIQRLTVSKRWSPNLCYMDPEATLYPCHLFGYWSKLMIMSTDSSSVNQLFVCHNDGRATYHNLQNLQTASKFESGCPELSVMSMFASDHHLYVVDIKEGRKILRFQPKLPEHIVMTKKKRLHSSIDSNWLQQNDYLQFVSMFETDSSVYLVFRETAEEDLGFCLRKVVKSRIARVSKDDKGGSSYRLVNNWISFVKATLVCFDSDSTSWDSSLRYVESAYYDNERKFIYATFSTGRSPPFSSAICQYSINDIDAALDGLYMNVKDSKAPIPKYETNCLNSNEDCQIQRAVKYQLKFSPVLPTLKRNFIEQRGEIWTHIQVIPLDRSGRQYDVVFVATSTNKIKKFYRKLTDNFLCYSETLTLSQNSEEVSSIRDMKVINSKKSPQLFLLVTVTNGIYKVAVEHCQIHVTEHLCMDPFCYWEDSSGLCKSIFQLEVYKLRQLPQLTQCSDGNELFDPIWKQWTSWQMSLENTCETRTRACKRGSCVNYGGFVHDVEIQVKNCSVLNLWSSWSQWSGCSSTCGAGTKTRRRWCFQDATCPGESSETHDCIIDNQCNKGSNMTYNSWSDWSACSTKCGEGVMVRTKPCVEKSTGDHTSCQLIESQTCVGNSCKEFSTFTVGQLTQGLSEDFYVAKCYGRVSGENDIEAAVEYEIKKSNDTSDLVWKCWSEWSNCSGYCYGAHHEDFQRWRTRTCKLDDAGVAKKLCFGLSNEGEKCKEEDCPEALMVSGNEERGYQLVYIILVGVATFTATCIFVIIGVCIYFEKNKPLSKHTSFNMETNTLNRRSTYMGTSYSPIPHSPPTSPVYKMDPYSVDIYNSVTRNFKRTNPSPTYMAPPSLTDNIPMASMH